MNTLDQQPVPWWRLGAAWIGGTVVVALLGWKEVTLLPSLSAAFNTIALGLLLAGYGAIRRQREVLHRNLMIGALVASVLFLESYLVHHYQVGHVQFRGTGVVRLVYYPVLISHVVLAAVVPFLALGVIVLGLRDRRDRHRRLARWTLPLWIYVSITGVVIYWLLYHYPVASSASLETTTGVLWLGEKVKIKWVP